MASLANEIKSAQHPPTAVKFTETVEGKIQNKPPSSSRGDLEPTSGPGKYGQDYKPLPLRRPYLFLVFLYTCCLIFLLEYALHVLPQISSRRTSPLENDSFQGPSDVPLALVSTSTVPSAPESTGISTTSTARMVRWREEAIETSIPFNSTTGFPNATASVTNFTGEATATRTTSGTAPFTEPSVNLYHLGPSQYADLDPYIVIGHFRWNFIWTHGPGGVMAYPVPTGVDVSDRCVSYKLGAWLTDDPGDCRLLVKYTGPTDPETGRMWTGTPLRENEQCIQEEKDMRKSYGNIHDEGECWREERMAKTTFINPKNTAVGAISSPDDGGVELQPIPTPSPSLITTTQMMVTTLAPVISTVSTTTTGADGKPTTRLIVTTLTSMISTVTTTTTGIDGKPTAVIFTTTFPGQAITTLVTITTSTTQDDHIVVDGTVYTLTNSLGQPTATLTSLPAGVLRPATFITTTVTNSLGQPTATITTDVPISLSTTLLTFYDNGTPVRTQTQYILPPAPRPTYLYPPDNGGSPVPGKVIWVDPLTASAYFAGSFLPVLLATLLAIPIQILNTNLHAMTPFQALTRSGGVPVKDSLLLSSSGGENFLQARWAAVRLAYCHKEPVLLLSDLLLGLVVVLVSLASEGVGMTLEGDCEEGGFQGCYLSLAIVQGPARAAEGLLVAICLGVVGVGVCVGRSRSQWRSGVRSNPRCIAAVAGLLAASDGRVKELILGVDTPTDGKLVPAKGLRDWFGEQRFAMAESGGGIVVVGDPLRRRATFSSGQQRTPSGGLKRQYTNMTTRHKNTVVLEYGFRVLFLAILCGLLSIVVYYGSTQLRRDDLFEHFMDSQTFGVAFLFTGTGVVMDLFWDHFFSRTEMLEPYRRLARPTASTHADLIRPRSSNVFSGLFRAAVHGNVFAGAVASAGVLAKFVPIFLANVPFRLTLTWITFMTCTWISVTILSLMVVVLLVSFLVRWPYLPVDPGTIAGCMYYVCDSRMLADLKAVADLDEGARHRHLRDIGMRYRCGSMVGVSAKRRIGID